MEIPKKYFHDKPVLAVLSANLFLSLLSIITILLRLTTNTAEVFTVQYRENLGLNGYQAGTVIDILLFIAFAVVIMFVCISLSLRVYDMKRQLAVIVLGMGTLLLLLTLIVSNALLVLQ